jgi:hypothetical protein
MSQAPSNISLIAIKEPKNHWTIVGSRIFPESSHTAERHEVSLGKVEMVGTEAEAVEFAKKRARELKVKLGADKWYVSILKRRPGLPDMIASGS